MTEHITRHFYRRLLSVFSQYQLVFQLMVVVAILLVLVAQGQFPSTERIATVFIFVFLWTPKGRAFLIGFGPFLLLLVTYKQLRNYADDLTMTQINVENLVEWERSMFGGTLPGYYLQAHLWDQPYTPVLDVITNTLYLSHFFSPLVLAVLLWYKERRMYWVYTIGLVVLSYAGFATYILFPAAPPWWATRYGYLLDQPITLEHFVTSADTVAKGANPVAAMPSLHAAYPSYIALVALSTWRSKALPVILLPLGVIFATVYLGHHYAIDAVAGALYAALTFSTVFVAVDRFTASHELFSQRVPLKPDMRTKTNART